jgi:hypothetical protein
MSLLVQGSFQLLDARSIYGYLPDSKWLREEIATEANHSSISLCSNTEHPCR